MTEKKPLTIREASYSDLEQVSEILTKAFYNDPAFARITAAAPATEGVLEHIFDMQLEKHYFPKGVIDTGWDADGKLVTVALWDKPGSSLSLADQAKMLPDYVRLFGRAIATAAVRQFRTSAYHLKFPHWYLYTIAVDPDCQGGGYGSQMLEHGIERAGDDPIYLEASTPRSAALYNRKGFVPLGLIPDRDSMVSETAMWRPGAMPNAEKDNSRK